MISSHGWSSWSALCLLHLAAVASPGPDFLLVTRNTLRGSALFVLTGKR